MSGSRHHRGRNAVSAAFRGLHEIVTTNVRNAGRTLAMARFELAKRYSGSLLGIGWAVVRPAVFIGVYWFAISVGLRGGKPIEGVPYIFWLIPGIVPWFFLNDALTIGGTSIRDHRHLVTKMVFPVATIPVFTVVSLFIAHLMLLVPSALILAFAGPGVSVHTVQIVYYLAATLLFASVAATLISTLSAISPDVGHMVRSVTRVMFWVTPIIWPLSSVHGLLRWVILANPLTYLIEGYRHTFLAHDWIFGSLRYSVYFWALTGLLMLLSGYLFARLKPDFADVL
jgi:ABC-type polysaccharide/polyol phosphate export permease